jgi:integrase
MTKSERQRRKVEVLNSFGANSVEQFNKVNAIGMGHTFREQAKKWLQQRMTRKRKPVKPATVRGWESYLDNHLNPLIGDMVLRHINNATLKMLGENLSAVGLSPTTIHDVAKVMRWPKASAVDEDGEQLYPAKWNYEFADIPVIGHQHTPMFTGEEITKIIAEAEKQERVIYVLFAASGLRAGELFGLEVKLFNGDTITVAQSVWEGRVQTPKTVNALRQWTCIRPLRQCSGISLATGNRAFSFGLARGHHFFNQTSFVALCIRFSKNSKSRNRASTASADSVSPTLNLATCHPPS